MTRRKLIEAIVIFAIAFIVTMGLPSVTRREAQKPVGIAEAQAQTSGAPRINLEEVRYPVEPSDTEDGLRKNLNNSDRPSSKTNPDLKFDGFVSWSVQWDFEVESCKVVNPTASGWAKLTMPKVQSPESMPETLQAEWKRYWDALYGHERNHVKHGEQALSNVWPLLTNSVSECATFDGVNQQLATEVAKWIEADQEYDRVTNHGETEGARFPR